MTELDVVSLNGGPMAAGVIEGSHAGGAAARLRDEFAPRISEARHQFAAAVAEMQDVIVSMRDEGRPSSHRLVHTLGDCRRTFLRLRLDLIRQAQALSLPIPLPDALNGLEDLARLLGSFPEATVDTSVPPTTEPDPVGPAPKAVAWMGNSQAWTSEAEVAEGSSAILHVNRTEELGEAAAIVHEFVVEASPLPPPDGDGTDGESTDQNNRRAALEVVDKIERLFVRDGGDLPALKDCRQQAVQLRDRLLDPSPGVTDEATALARGDHPLAQLLNVVVGVDSLGDAQWAAVHATLTESFGRQVAVAAARGKLGFAPTD